MILFQCDRFKVEITESGESWTVYPGSSLIEAMSIYRDYREKYPLIEQMANNIMNNYEPVFKKLSDS